MNARGKTSTVNRNVANVIDEHVRSAWPELCAVGDVWFTGSRIWSWLYGNHPIHDADWDIFVLSDHEAQAVADRLGLRALPSCPTRDKRKIDAVWSTCNVPTLMTSDEFFRLPPGQREEASKVGAGYSDGFCYRTSRGLLDLWIAEPGGVLAEIRAYPTASHAHCRAAYSMVDGLVVLPNEAAR